MGVDKPEPQLPERAPAWYEAPWVRRLALVALGIGGAVGCPLIPNPSVQGICRTVSQLLTTIPGLQEPWPRCESKPCGSYSGASYTQEELDGGTCSCPARGP